MMADRKIDQDEQSPLHSFGRHTGLTYDGPLSPNTATSPENDNDMADDHILDSQSSVFGPPPAHLAARFYRNRVNARRKSSATSSRRNSLSSVHSHASSRSHRRSSTPACQSHYIAQHLRRQSFMDSRRARLADRAAHVEQVRLRAALVKAAPRGTTTSEERVIAAQIAKEKYLAKVAATCAEEVARAKRIAEEVKERKLAEETRQRLEIEGRHAEAERRRAEYQRNLQARRARRADSSEKKLAVVDEVRDVEDQPSTIPNEAVAATRIQRAWRLSQRRAIISAFVKLDMNIDRAQSTSFEDMTALIAKEDVINKTTALLMHLGLQAADDDHAHLSTRTFLSTFLILGHPVAVLNTKNGAQEQDLMSKASDLLSHFQTTLGRLAAWNHYTPGATQRETLSQAYSSYTSAFAAWRLQDSSVLIDGMVASFVELDAIWQTVKDDSRGEVASDYREGIRDNQVMLLSRIRKLAGPDRADFLIKKAIRESRRLRPKKRPAAEVRPRGLETGAASAAQAEESDSAVENAIQVTELQSDEITRKLFTPMPSNRVLTHELAVDKDFRLFDNAAALRDEVYQSVCDAMKHGFESGDGAVWTISAAENIREKLLRMLKPGNSMHHLVSETLSLEQIARQAKAGVFSYEGFFNFMADVLPKLCAPFRDAEIATLVQHLRTDDNSLDSMIRKLFRLLRSVDMLSLDYTNFMLMNAAPTLIKEAAGYEARQFAADLQSGRITLYRTKRWWDEAAGTLRAEADRRDPEGVNRSNPNEQPGTEKIYARALVDLAIEQGNLTSESVPETLALDTERLQKVRTHAVRVAVIGAILLTAKNLLKRDVRGQWRKEAGRLWQLLDSEGFNHKPEENDGAGDEVTTATKAFGILEAAHNLPPSTKSQLSNAVARFFSQAAAVQGAGRLSDPVLKVLYSRLRTHVLNRLSAVTSSERVRAASSASEALTSIGLGELTVQVGQMVDTLDRVRTVDLQSHGTWYKEVIREAQETSADG